MVPDEDGGDEAESDIQPARGPSGKEIAQNVSSRTAELLSTLRAGPTSAKATNVPPAAIREGLTLNPTLNPRAASVPGDTGRGQASPAPVHRTVVVEEAFEYQVRF